MIELRPSDILFQKARKIQRFAGLFGQASGLALDLYNAQAVDQGNKWLLFEAQAQDAYDEELPKRMFDVPVEPDVIFPTGTTQATVSKRFGELSEADLITDHNKYVEAQMDWIKENLTNKDARNRAIYQVQQRAIPHLAAVRVAWNEAAQHEANASLNALEDIMLAKVANVGWEQPTTEFGERIRETVRVGRMWREEGEVRLRKFTDAAQVSWATTGALTEMKAGGVEAGEKWIAENTPFWEGNPDARAKVLEDVQQKYQEQIGRQQKILYEEFLSRASTEMDFRALAKEGFSKYLDNVSQKTKIVVQRYIDSAAASKPAEAAQKKLQMVLYARMSQQMRSWDGTEEVPWTLDTLTQLLAKGVLEESQGDKLKVDFAAMQQETETGERTPAQAQQKRNASDFFSRMHGAIDDKIDPAVAVPRGEIEDTYREGKISIAQRDKSIADRDRLHGDWLALVEQEKKLRGPLREDPAAEAKLWAIVLDDRLSATAKFEKAQPYLFNGVPGARWKQITAHIDELNNRPDWKLRSDSLNQFYNASIGALEKSDDERMKLSLEKAAAGGALMQLFRKYPDDPSKWDEGLRSLLDPRVKKEVLKKVQERLQARFPGFLGVGGISEAMQLETAAEQLGAEFAAAPGLVAQRAIKAEDIAEQEQRILKDSKIQIVDRFQDENGTWTYSTEPIPRDPTTGKPILDALRKAGKLYQVRSRVEGGKILQLAGRIK